MAEWSNWSGRQTDSPVAIVAPTSESDIVEAVAAAAITEMPVRAVGASHSHSRIAATNGMLLTLDGWQGIEAVDTEAQTARIRSGTRIFQLGEPLLEHGLAIRNQGDIDRQSVAGATSTGTHGTGPSLQNLSASVEGARIVLASGDVVDCSPAATPELFEIVRHSLGAVGLITELTLALAALPIACTRRCGRKTRRPYSVGSTNSLRRLATSSSSGCRRPTPVRVSRSPKPTPRSMRSLTASLSESAGATM